MTTVPAARGAARSKALPNWLLSVASTRVVPPSSRLERTVSGAKPPVVSMSAPSLPSAVTRPAMGRSRIRPPLPVTVMDPGTVAAAAVRKRNNVPDSPTETFMGLPGSNRGPGRGLSPAPPHLEAIPASGRAAAQRTDRGDRGLDVFPRPEAR